MNRIISELVENRVFEGLAFTENMLEKAIYEDCSFIRCNFNASDLSGSIFRNCRFVNCDLSLAKLRDTGFQEVHFSGCKLLGTVFSDCSKLLFEAGFEHCMMKLSSFQNMKLRNTKLLKCDLREADFTGTDLSCSTFAECDLLLAIFHHTNLEGSDLRTAFNFSINPENNRLRKTRFSAEGLAGLLDSYGIVIG